LEVVGFDLRPARNGTPSCDVMGDICDADALAETMRGCAGVIHLAAVSRVIWGEQDPLRCWQTNTRGVHNVLRAAFDQTERPWVISASSREVYGEPQTLPVAEDAPCIPVNIYGHSKLQGEHWLTQARTQGLSAAVIRLSNVYGCIWDHADRVIPAFTRAALAGRTLRVEGCQHCFDFTHIDDVCRGIMAVVRLLIDDQSPPPPIHLLTGRATTLGQLAALVTQAAGSCSVIEEHPPRNFDVARFYGDPSRAAAMLGWQAQVDLSEGIPRLIADFRQQSERGTPQ